MLANTRAVLDCTIAETRATRGSYRGIESSQAVTHDSISTAEAVFAEIDSEQKGLIPFDEIFPVLGVLGVSLDEEEKEELLRVLEITPQTEISFPEVVDIAAFYGH
jgi:Ca2+-binding EF-hand superfamily protein